MYEFKYHKSTTRIEYKINKILDDTTIFYYFYLITESFQDDKDNETSFDCIIEWSRTEWDQNARQLSDMEYSAVVSYGDFLSIAELLSHKQYDEVFEKLNKLENVRVIRYNN